MPDPTLSTIKRLFSLCGNRCAFPRCEAAVVQGESVVAEVCHIRARSVGGPRFDPTQSEAERNSYDNLILLCGTHHTVVDADTVAYTVERLESMKREHESGADRVPEPSDAIARSLVISSHGQSGGITAHTVNVAAQSQPQFSRDQLEAMLAGNLHREVEVTNGFWEAATNTMTPIRWTPQSVRIGLIRDDTFALTVPRGPIWAVTIPYQLVRGWWKTIDDRIALRLDGRLVLRQGGIFFEEAG